MRYDYPSDVPPTRTMRRLIAALTAGTTATPEGRPMTSTYRTMTTEHLGPDATETDLAEFRSICEAAQRLHPEMDDAAVTDAVFGDGDYYRNARRLGVDVGAIVAD